MTWWGQHSINTGEQGLREYNFNGQVSTGFQMLSSETSFKRISHVTPLLKSTASHCIYDAIKTPSSGFHIQVPQILSPAYTSDHAL